MRDAEVGRSWIENQSIAVTDKLWLKAQYFHREKNP
jgi:hypothetical protein